MTNATANVNKVLESLILVSLSEIHGISGRKKLKREDFGDNVELPPDVIVSLGSKKVIDPKLLNPFTQYKTKAHALCSAVGIRFLGGYAVPADRVNDLISSLNDVKTEFYIYKKTFLQSDFDSWIDQCEEKYRKILRDGASVDTEYMENQIQFGFTAIHITPYGNSVIQEGIAGQIKSLTDEVFEEVSGLVDGFLKNLNQNAFTQHTINPLRRTADKLASLGFISERVNKLAVYISDVLADVPVTGKVTGRKYSDILSLLNNLRDPQRAKSFVDLLNANSEINQSQSGNGFMDLSPADDILTYDESTHSQPLVTPTILSPTAQIEHAVDDIGICKLSADEFHAELASDLEIHPTVPNLDFPKRDNDFPLNDGLATDLPSGNEVICEPDIIECEPDSSRSLSVEDEFSTRNESLNSVEGFRNVEVVEDSDMDEISKPNHSVFDKPDDFGFDSSDDEILLF
ncbi:DUF3150 domain-containing protein [Cronobacter turicensis]